MKNPARHSCEYVSMDVTRRVDLAIAISAYEKRRFPAVGFTADDIKAQVDGEGKDGVEELLRNPMYDGDQHF